MKNILYTEHADLYYTIAKDRDFLIECKEFIHLYEKANQFTFPNQAHVLELFAGPGYHAHYFNEHFTSNVFCMDNSAEMLTIACKQHHLNSNQYYLGAIPQVITSLPDTLKFDLIICPRYSIGLIADADFKKLFSNLQYHVNPGCVLIFECHRIQNLLSNFNQLTIKNRKSLNETQQLTCAWPHNQIVWHEDEWSVQMPIEVILIQGKRKKVIQTYSKERIYVKNDFKLLLDGCPIYSVLDDIHCENSVFNQSKLIVIKVSSLV